MYLHDWKNKEDLIGDFGLKEDDLEGAEILLASRTYGDYEGEAFVLFERNGKLYEVNGRDDSLTMLDKQWDPEEVTIEVLAHRLQKGMLGKSTLISRRWGENIFASELIKILIKKIRD
jgi:hypothetical protein